ncbi:hypothetical protein FACS1894156_0990 [Bacteroidia bacterium]|nr:hypothetical protein FACS1894156_0990 [Bacteroidia bacterium]
MKKLSLLLFIFSVFSARAQHEILVYGLGGVSDLRYTPALSDVKKSVGFGGGLGLGYAYSLSPRWKIITGAEYVLFSSTTRAGNLSGTYTMSDPTAGSIADYLFEYQHLGYEGTQYATYLQIPLMLSISTVHRDAYNCGCNEIVPKGNQTGRWYMAAGVKAGIAHIARNKMLIRHIQTRGTFDEYETFENMPDHGFQTIEKYTDQSTMNLGLNLALALEMGARFTLNKTTHLYTSLFADYGLFNIAAANKNSGQIKQLDNFHNETLNTFLTAINNVDKLNLIGFGVKVKIGFELNKK